MKKRPKITERGIDILDILYVDYTSDLHGPSTCRKNNFLGFLQPLFYQNPQIMGRQLYPYLVSPEKKILNYPALVSLRNVYENRIIHAMTGTLSHCHTHGL